jgi:hypothetical protein
MGKSLSKVYEERLKRQYERYPTLQALRPMNNISTTFRRFYQQAKGIPFYRFDLTESEHAELAKSTDDELCCFNHLISLPIDKNHNYRILYDYQAYVSAMLGIEINNDFLLSSFCQKNNIPIPDIHNKLQYLIGCALLIAAIGALHQIGRGCRGCCVLLYSSLFQYHRYLLEDTVAIDYR